MKKQLAMIVTVCLCFLAVGCGEPASTSTPSVSSAVTSGQEVSSLDNVPIGIYLSVDRDEFIIHSINENKMKFSVNWYRANGIDNAMVEISETKGSFTWEKDPGKEYVVGQIEFVDEKIILLTLTESTLYAVESKTYKYEYFGTAEEYTSALNKSVLTMNDDEKGWSYAITWGEGGFEGFNTTTYYLRFNEDGSYMGWKTVQIGEIDSSITQYEGHYDIKGNILYLDEDAYDLYAYAAGDVTMNLKAKGNYKNDFSGDYNFLSGTLYKYLVEDAKNKKTNIQ